MSAVLEAREPSARYLDVVRPALVRQFDLLATAPGAVARLRELIVTLSVRGKLMPQIHSDGLADRLLSRARAAKRDLAASGQIGRDKPVEPVSDDDTSFLLPRGWVWCRLGDLAWPQAGFAFKSAGFNEVGQGLPLIRIRDVGSGVGPTTFFSGEHRMEFLVEPGEWLVSMDGEFRVRQWHASTALLNQRVTRLVFASGEVQAAFVAMALQRELTALQGTKAYTTVDHLSGQQIAEAVIALPPPIEQARIVARVDELMRLCDALEAQGRLEAEQHARLLGTLLGTLTDSSTAEELAANWQRVAHHFDLLLDRPEAVDAIEQTILQLAVRGLLVSQDLRDEPAALFVSRISAGRVAKRNAAAQATLADIDRPGLPVGWCVTTVGSVAECLDYIRRPVKRADREASGGTVPYYGANGQVGWINEHLFDEDLVLVVEDETFIGRIKPFSYVVRGKSWVNNHAHVLRPLGGMSAEFLNLCLQRYDFIPLTSGTTNRRKLTQPGLLNAEFMIGPLDEQVRILARVTQLRRLCADLRQRLAASQTVQSNLADVLVEQAIS